jgi:glutathione-specific gamma-glutamylcyclotransferase
LARALRLTKELVSRVPPAPLPFAAPEETRARASDEDHAAALAALDARRPAAATREALWVFAYGSLIWNPCFPFVEARRALAHGWHRAFCLGWLTWFRGSPERPGLMMALDRGGSCEGVAFRLPPEGADEALAALVRREMPFAVSGMAARWMPLRTAAGPLPAVGFVINRAACDYVPGLTEDQIVASLATAAGSAGSMAEYLLNTITHLQEHGIHDRSLWHLQDRVAAVLEREGPA